MVSLMVTAEGRAGRLVLCCLCVYVMRVVRVVPFGLTAYVKCVPVTAHLRL